MTIMEGYMTLAELAAYLGLKSVTGLRAQIHRGVLRATRVGTGRHAIWLVAEGEAERYREEHLGKRGFSSPSHPYHKKRPPRTAE
jgi:excisionase family DNA binding protein